MSALLSSVVSQERHFLLDNIVAIGGVLIDQVHDISCEPAHILGQSKAQVPKRIGLVPLESVWVEYGSELLIVRNSGKFVQSANKQGSWDCDLLERNLLWLALPIGFYIFYVSKVVLQHVFVVD